jgi:uroporphyrin-III C-methyltransferase/precorrin-2 dehydrogenase/sirohydrochlorin ferrochelatase
VAAEDDDAQLYPLFLKVAGRPVLVVGGGSVAERKIQGLVAARALVRVVAPHATVGIEALAGAGTVEWRAGPFEERDMEGVWLVFAATSDGEVQGRIAAAASARRVFVVAVDDPAHATAYSGAVIERPPFLVAISSSGATPALTRLLREVLSEVLPRERWVARARELRAKWKADGTPMADRFAELVRDFKGSA